MLAYYPLVENNRNLFLLCKELLYSFYTGMASSLVWFFSLGFLDLSSLQELVVMFVNFSILLLNGYLTVNRFDTLVFH